MDIERLTARNKDGLAYLVNVKPDEQEVDSPYENTLKCILDCFERLAQYEEEDIARQTTTCPDCGGSGVYQEYDEYDRYTVHSCATCDGSGEITRQSATSEEVQRAIEQLKYAREQDREFDDGTFVDSLELAITALQAYQPWVNVEDRLPDGNVSSVLIFTEDGGVAEGQYYPSIDSWKQFRWSVENSKVTHWRPLPEAPKGE